MSDSDVDEDKRLTQQAAVMRLQPKYLKAWNECRFTYRTFAHENKIFAIWHVVDAEVVVLGSLRILQPSLSTETGLSLAALLKVEGFETDICITHTPTPVYEDKVFVAIPHIITARFCPQGFQGNFVLQTPVVIKSQAKPYDPVYGTRMTQLSEFRAKYPQFKEARI